ncbi:membrane protein [Photobacterium leiognathi]|uniref:Uncharacterized protein n=1 Tax=Photobacterium leiognathi TaxID=553611 RepID=A0ABX5GJB5_PHOLE|nr:membrane protein [Photobacterium leiognathi]KJF91445.1 membrane protein [Photobacterium leiognathi]PSU96430.1 hypothetical protein C0W80_17155 [Photobacterium leiognathi subsp. mandapamensis]PSV85891.1 hypothetical protein CTM94_04000 [Photobacterium leiognathi]
MKHASLFAYTALFSPLALAQSDNIQPQQNMVYTLAITIIFLIAVACYHVTKKKVRQHKPQAPSFLHHLIGFVIGFVCFYVLFYFLGMCL